MKGGKIAAVLCNILGTLILLSVIVTFIPVTVPRLMGYQIYNIVSGSMEPEIPVGSLIYAEPVQPAQVQEGEIITYYSGNFVVTHRVVQNRLVEGEFVTKGDANEQEDISTISYASLVGRVKYHIPYIGELLVIYTSGVGKVYVICYAACGAMFNILASRIRYRAKKSQQQGKIEENVI